MADPDQIISFGFAELSLRNLLHFIEFPEFTADCKSFGLSDDDLLKLQVQIMKTGMNAPVIPGTGGIRKLRFVPNNWDQGKRSALRICFALFPRFHTAILIYMYAKNVQENLSPRAKDALKKIMLTSEKELDRLNQLRKRRYP